MRSCSAPRCSPPYRCHTSAERGPSYWRNHSPVHTTIRQKYTNARRNLFSAGNGFASGARKTFPIWQPSCSRCCRPEYFGSTDQGRPAQSALQCVQTSWLCDTPRDERWGVTLRGGLTSSTTIRCPYHQWTYGLDGELLSAPFLPESEHFQKGHFSLYPVGLETWGGFFFVNLSPEQEVIKERPLLSQLGHIPGLLSRYPLGELRTAKQITYDVAANWKVIMENYNECYHCGPVHPELCEIVPDFKRAGGAHLDWVSGIPHRPGAYTFTSTGTTERQPFSSLNEEEKVRHMGELIYPNMLLSLSCDHVVAFLLSPQGPTRTCIACNFLFHLNEIQKASFDPSDAVDFWDRINRQVWAICERVQAGLKSRAHQFGYYAPMENPSADIRRYVGPQLGQAAPGSPE